MGKLHALTLLLLDGVAGITLGHHPAASRARDFPYVADRFGDSEVIRYRVPGFSDLTLQQKTLLYYLHEAALAGRDIIYDQQYHLNLIVRRTLEALVRAGPQSPDDPEWQTIVDYTKKVWFSNGLHHEYSGAKHAPEMSETYFINQLVRMDPGQLPLEPWMNMTDFLGQVVPAIFDPAKDPKRTNRDADADAVADSANNFYRDLTAPEVHTYYDSLKDPEDPAPVLYGLNSQLVKEPDGSIVERVWRQDGMYGQAITQIARWLSMASAVADTPKQQAALLKLVEYYQTGDLRAWDEYNIMWVEDTDSTIDFNNGFIEVYDDALNIKGSWQSVVYFKDLEASEKISLIGSQAQWFEDNSPLMEEHKKPNVVGISALVATVVVEGGDTSPMSPIGINLPNSNWMRVKHGSKSIMLGNIVSAYGEAAAGSNLTKEFAYSPEEAARSKEYGTLSHDLHVYMHEVIGHGSGQLNPGVGDPSETLRNYASTLEEARADLVALYYAIDPKLVELGLMPNLEVGQTEYESYIRNGLMVQLSRLQAGENLEESHMRQRQMITAWAVEMGKADNVIERVTREDASGRAKTYFRINDYEKLRYIFGQQLREVQRIKSEGDFDACQQLVETYGVQVDHVLHQEVLERYAALNIATYKGFLQPKLVPVVTDGEIEDVIVEYQPSFSEYMLDLSERHSFLPSTN